MKDRVCIVTGANTGIGRVSAHELARMGAHVFLASRSESKTVPVVELIRRDTGNDRVEYLPLDLGDLESVGRCAEAFLARDLPLHVLMNNAGLAGLRGVTASGFEMAFGVNHVGHFAFTLALLDRIKSSAPARIVNIASEAHYNAKGIDYDVLRKPTRTVSGVAEYNVSKLANVLFTKELARRLEGTGVTTYALHPGVIASDVWRKVPQPFRWLITRFMLTVEDGAKTQLRCATAPELAGETGLYYDDCKQKTPSRWAQDADAASKLWAESEAWVTA